jgi:hypothetical protein
VKISEVSSVDAGAAPGARIMLRKRADRERAVLKAKLDRATAALAVSVKSIVNDPECNDRRGMLARTFGQYLVHVNPRTSIRDVAKFHEIFSKNLDVPVDPDGPINPGGDDSDGTRIERGFGDDNDEAARLDAEMDADDDERDDDDEERLRDAMKREDDMKDPMRRLKSLDVVQICKTMSSEGSAFGLSEHDLVDLISKHAERTGTTFAKLFTAQDEQGVTLRKAIDVCKHEQDGHGEQGRWHAGPCDARAAR